MHSITSRNAVKGYGRMEMYQHCMMQDSLKLINRKIYFIASIPEVPDDALPVKHCINLVQSSEHTLRVTLLRISIIFMRFTSRNLLFLPTDLMDHGY